MAIALKSVFQIAANNIVSSASRSKSSLGTVKKEYNDIVRFLDLQKKQIENIKLPDKKKISQLANINIASTFGAPGNLLRSLLGGGLDLAGFVGEMFPSKGKPGKAQPTVKSPQVKVKGNELRFGGLKALGVLNSVFAGLDFYQGIKGGEGVGKAASGAGASLAGSIIGGALGSVLGPLGTFAGASIGGMAGGWLGDRAYEGVTGTGSKDGVKQKLERKIKAQEAAQKAAVQGGNFEDIITRFSSAVSKFEEGVSSGLFGTLGQQGEPPMDELGEPPVSSYEENPDASPENTYTAEGGELPSKNMTSGYGWRRGRMHKGVDFAHPTTNVPISILQPGIVDVGFDAEGWGNYVKVKHDSGVETLYGHLSKVNVKRGQRIEAGTVIGNQGSTGKSTGPHVHFEYKPGGPGTATVDGRSVADSYFRFGGQVTVKKNGTKNTDAMEDLKELPNNYPQKKPEEFFKGTPQENIFKDAKLKEEFSGKSKTPEVKAAQTKYNEYVNQIKQQRAQQVSAQPTQMVAPATPVQMPQIQQYPSYSQSQSYIIDRPSIIAMGGGGGSSQPVYIPVGGGDGGGTSLPSGPSEGEVVNSLIKTLLLTNLSAS